MTVYRVAVHITPREGLLDPQGKAVEGALHSLGFTGVRGAHVGRYIVLDVEAPSGEAATDAARAMCDRVLANPVTEDYEVETPTEE